MELDELENRNFELERSMKEHEKLKSETIPKLKQELEELR